MVSITSPRPFRHALVGAAIVAGCTVAVLGFNGSDSPVVAAAQPTTASSTSAPALPTAGVAGSTAVAAPTLLPPARPSIDAVPAVPSSSADPTRTPEPSAAPAVAEGVAPTAAPTAAPTLAPAADTSGNWMTDLLPQVDPAGIAGWVFERNGSWGASDGHTVWIDPDLPPDKRFSVMAHEYSHILQVRVYGSLDASVAGLSALIGGGDADVTANESTADCMALALGATWVNYGCQDSLQPAASAILAGQHP